jgi:hypothetical protein
VLGTSDLKEGAAVEQLKSNHLENRATRKEGEADHRRHKRKPSEKKIWRYKEGTMWHGDPLLSKGSVNNTRCYATDS